jgi:phenol/toluene 2-monooxygenase (NADH) P0/A0
MPSSTHVKDSGPQTRKYVRVQERHPNGLVKFEFAVGWPDLCCELVLPTSLFDDFCQQHRVEFLTGPGETGMNTLPADHTAE